jgi:O-antigen/teichoic acid export membrane protein
MSRTRNSAWNLASGILYTLTAAAAGLIATPLLLGWLGAERLGAYKALTDWFGYLVFFEVGLSGALMALLAGRLAQGGHATVITMLAAGLRAYRGVTIAQFAGVVALTGALPYLIPSNHLDANELRIAGAIAGLPVVFTPLLVFRSLAEARQRGYLIWQLMTAQVLTLNGLQLLTAFLGWGLIGQCLAFAAAQIPLLLVPIWDSLRTYRGVWKAVAEKADRSALWNLSWPTFVHGLTDRIGLASDSILVALILGSAAVTPFFLTQQLAILAQSLLRGVGQATWAGLAELHAGDQKSILRTRLLELTGMVSGLSWALLTPIALCNPNFVRLWVGSEVYAGKAVTGLACFNALLWAIAALWGWTLLGAGYIRRWMPFAVLSTLVNVTVSVIATAKLGVIGPLLGTTAGHLLVGSWALPRILSQAFGVPTQSLWRAALSPLRWSMPYAAALWSVAAYRPSIIDADHWVGFAVNLGLSSALGLSLWWTFSLGHSERAEWLARVKGLLP